MYRSGLKRNNAPPLAVVVDSIGVICRIQKQFFNINLGNIGFCGKKCIQCGKRVMPTSAFQHWEYRKVMCRIGSHIQVQVVTEKVAFPVGISSPVAFRLRIMPLAGAELNPPFSCSCRGVF